MLQPRSSWRQDGKDAADLNDHNDGGNADKLVCVHNHYHRDDDDDDNDHNYDVADRRLSLL